MTRANWPNFSKYIFLEVLQPPTNNNPATGGEEGGNNEDDLEVLMVRNPTDPQNQGNGTK
jgi:hypothetical protein